LKAGFSRSLRFVMTAIMTSFGFLRHFSLPQIRVSIYWWQYTDDFEVPNNSVHH